MRFASILIIIGVVLFVIGIGGVIQTTNKTKGFLDVKGKYISRTVYSSGKDGTTYRLHYSYVVKGNEYTATTDYGTNVIPKVGSEKTIKYDPSDPSCSVVPGSGFNAIMLFGGFICIAIAMLDIVSSSDGRFAKLKANGGVVFGFVFSTMGFGGYYLMCAGTDSLSPLTAFRSAGLFTLIPMSFMAVGVLALFTTLFPSVSLTWTRSQKQKSIMLKVVHTEPCYDKFRVVFSNNTASTGHYFTYYTYRNFQIGEEYNIDLFKHGTSITFEDISGYHHAIRLSAFCDDDFEPAFACG